MRLATIWTIPAMTFGERIRRTVDLTAQAAAARLPKRVRYWAFVQVGGAAITADAVVTEQSFMDVLARAEGGPR
ncbi:hypothetical protein UQW22_09960 [Isoptericola halotolerans]|uniref:hypothetical protein n=1 Tax=Isoptericola halotolerans TaxID=300560 RepID=UPI00388D5C41